MTVKGKMVHNFFLLLFGLSFNWVNYTLKLRKSDTFLQNIHPGPFDRYIETQTKVREKFPGIDTALFCYPESYTQTKPLL